MLEKLLKHNFILRLAKSIFESKVNHVLINLKYEKSKIYKFHIFFYTHTKNFSINNYVWGLKSTPFHDMSSESDFRVIKPLLEYLLSLIKKDSKIMIKLR